MSKLTQTQVDSGYLPNGTRVDDGLGVDKLREVPPVVPAEIGNKDGVMQNASSVGAQGGWKSHERTVPAGNLRKEGT